MANNKGLTIALVSTVVLILSSAVGCSALSSIPGAARKHLRFQLMSQAILSAMYPVFRKFLQLSLLLLLHPVTNQKALSLKLYRLLHLKNSSSWSRNKLMKQVSAIPRSLLKSIMMKMVWYMITQQKIITPALILNILLRKSTSSLSETLLYTALHSRS